MARLTATLTPTLLPAAPVALPPRQPIRGRRFRGRRGILLPQRELSLQIDNSLRLLSDLLAEPFILLAQSLVFQRGAAIGVTPIRT
jgi:hypothetical protein